MKSLEVQLVEVLDRLSEKDAKAARKIHESKLSLEAKLNAVQTLLTGGATAAAWRESDADKLIVEIRESSPAFRAAVTKNNGAAFNHGGAVNEAHATLAKLAEAALGLGLSIKEARVFAGLDDANDAQTVQAILEVTDGD